MNEVRARGFARALATTWLLGFVAACGASASDKGGEAAKSAPPTALAPCSADACADLASCPLTSKEHLDAFDCRPCGDDAMKGCDDAKACPVRDARTLDALVCRAIAQKIPCKDAVEHALSGWRSQGEPPFLDDATLKTAIVERYARQAPGMACEGDPKK